MTRIMLVDDHRIFRQGVAGLFEPIKEMEVVAECGEGTAAVRLARQMSVDVIVMDISLPDMDGIQASEKILSQNPETRILLLSMLRDPYLFDRARGAGIRGYVLKDDAFDNLVYAIRAVVRGEEYFNLPSAAPAPAPLPGPPILTQREKEVVREICRGLSSREIAARLHISRKTVETHRAKIMEKLGVKNVAQLVKQVVERRLDRT